MKKIQCWIRNNSASVAQVLVYALLSILLLLDRMLWYDLCMLNFGGWVAIFHIMIPWTLLGMIPIWLLGRHSRWIYVVILILLLAMDGVGWFARLNFQMLLDGDLVGILLGSSQSEMKWFLGNYWFLIFIGIVSLVATSWGIIRMSSICKYATISRSTVMFAVSALMVFIYAKQLINRSFEFLRELACVNLIIDCNENVNYFKALARMKKNPDLPASLRQCPACTNRVVGVFVLGESATRSHWSLYGYPRSTTPELDARRDELVAYTDLVTLEGSTASSMRRIFTTSTLERGSDFRFTLSQVLQRSGFEVSLFSNHERWGEFGGLESFAFAGSNPLVFMRELYHEPKYDDVLIGQLSEEIGKRNGSQCVFLHFMGSHAPSCSQYPNGIGPFEAVGRTRASESASTPLSLNHYDNSIWYTDSLLGKAIKQLETIDCPTFLIYLSDHGETPSSKGWRNHNDRDLWDIPFVIWMSKSFRASFPDRVRMLEKAKDKPLQSDQLLLGLIHFFGVEGLEFSQEEDFLSDAFIPRSPRYIEGGRSVYNW